MTAQLAQEVTEFSHGAIAPCIVSPWLWEVTLGPGKLGFPALFAFNPSDALLRGWKRSWMAGERSSFPSNRSFLWSKQTAGVCFLTRGRFINKSQGFVLVFINFVEEMRPQDVCAQHLPQLGRDLSRNINVQVPLFSFLDIGDFPPSFQKRYSKVSAGRSKLTWRNS